MTKRKILRRCARTECGGPIDHKHQNARFCSAKCKDKHHNRVNPRGHFAHLHPDRWDDDDDPSWDAHKSHVETY